MRSKTTERNIWVQLGISACALLLPPMVLGAAIYSMLPARDDGAARPSAGSQPVAPKLRVRSASPWSVGTDPATDAQVSETVPLAAKPASVADGGSSLPAADLRSEPSGKSAKDMARVPNPVPVEIVAGAPLAKTDPLPPVDVDGAPPGAIGMEPPVSAAVEVPQGLLPRVLKPPAQTPLRVAPPQLPAVQVPPARVSSKAGSPSTEGAPATTAAHKHARPSALGNLVRHNGTRAEARGEAPPVRRNGQTQPHQTFSLKNWLQQLGSRTRDTRN